MDLEVIDKPGKRTPSGPCPAEHRSLVSEAAASEFSTLVARIGLVRRRHDTAHYSELSFPPPSAATKAERLGLEGS